MKTRPVGTQQKHVMVRSSNVKRGRAIDNMV